MSRLSLPARPARLSVHLSLRRLLSALLLLSLVAPLAPAPLAQAAAQGRHADASIAFAPAADSHFAPASSPASGEATVEQSAPAEPPAQPEALPPFDEPLPVPTAVPPVPAPAPLFELPTVTPLLPVALSLTTERGVLAADESILLTLRVESLGSTDSAALSPVDVTLLLPPGVVTVEGWSGGLGWKGMALAPGSPFVQTLRLQVEPGSALAAPGAQAVVEVAATASAVLRTGLDAASAGCDRQRGGGCSRCLC